MQFDLTPKALANFSPGFEEREPWGTITIKNGETLKGFANLRTLSGLERICMFDTQGCRWRSNPGLKLANAFGVNSTHITIKSSTHLP